MDINNPGRTEDDLPIASTFIEAKKFTDNIPDEINTFLGDGFKKFVKEHASSSVSVSSLSASSTSSTPAKQSAKTKINSSSSKKKKKVQILDPKDEKELTAVRELYPRFKDSDGNLRHNILF